MLTREQNLACFHAHAAAADLAIVDGMMGLFDGWDGRSDNGSTAQMAKWLNAPVLLVLDCWTLARSAGAMVKGYAELDPALRLAGLLLNKVGGDAHRHWLEDAIQAAGVAPPVLAGIPKVRLWLICTHASARGYHCRACVSGVCCQAMSLTQQYRVSLQGRLYTLEKGLRPFIGCLQ